MHTPMTPEDIAPELRDDIQKLPRVPVGNPVGRWLIRQAMRMMPAYKADDIKIEKQSTSHGTRLRIYTPAKIQTDAALLWIHGGGMVIGSAVQDDAFCAETARELGLTVVSVDYRLAPDYQFPIPLDDCQDAWHWLQTSASQLNIDNTRIAIGGESAGGGLAASLVQRIHDEGGVQPVAQWLFCPMLDDRTAARRELDVIKHKVWDNRQNHFGWKSFLGQEPGADQVPDYAVAGRRENLAGLPPAWIGTGDIELFYDENRDYAERLKAAGVDCTLDIVPNAPHGFQSVARNTTLAQAYLSRSHEWLQQQLISK